MLATVLLTSLGIASAAQAAVAPSLGAAASFAVLGGSTVTNTGPSVIQGDVGVSPGSAVTGFPPGIVVPPAAIHAGDGVAGSAQTSATGAFNALAGQQCDTALSSAELGGLTLTPGVYCVGSAQLTGVLTLDAQGDPNAVFIFQIASTLITASSSSVGITAGSGCNVFFQVGSSATLGTGTGFTGNILAQASITMNTSATLAGRALALTGAVTLDSNLIAPALCPPLGVTVRSFTATRSASSVLLKWQTASEVGTLGYNVYAQVNGKRVKLNSKLIAARSTATGASYAFRHRASKGQKAPSRFWLQAVNLDGTRTWYGEAKVARPNTS